jgi:hypothetical protein
MEISIFSLTYLGAVTTACFARKPTGGAYKTFVRKRLEPNDLR